jgi:hypothetical protein
MEKAGAFMSIDLTLIARFQRWQSGSKRVARTGCFVKNPPPAFRVAFIRSDPVDPHQLPDPSASE